MSSVRILVVEDDHLARISLVDFLQEAGYNVVAASCGEAGIRLQQEQPFDVCIVDIRMPGLDGVETIIALREISPASRFIIYTGSPQFMLSSTLQEIGMTKQDIVHKPVVDMSIFVPLIASKMERGDGG